ncbi:MAG TPA: glucokinase [Methylocella sp.]|nr:glucokinase [Methylocella sp.]
MRFPYPVLICDIGGTNARFAVAPEAGEPLAAGPHLKTRDYAGLEEALAEVFARLAVKPRSLIACAAGPVSGQSIKLTNADWRIDGRAVAARAGLEQGLLLNDFEAQGYSLPILEGGSAVPIGSFERTQGVQLILGPGTGLGAAALVETGGGHLVLASEAGHMGFGPLGAEEEAIWRHLDTGALGRVCAETILCGPGLLRLHKARCAGAAKTTSLTSEIALIQQAQADPSGEEARTLRLCWILMARFAGDLALAFLAKGGVTFAGGILPRIVNFCDPEQFRRAFENKAPYGEMMRAIGTRLIGTDDVVLTGMAAIAAAPQNYAIDYTNRAWR